MLWRGRLRSGARCTAAAALALFAATASSAPAQLPLPPVLPPGPQPSPSPQPPPSDEPAPPRPPPTTSSAGSAVTHRGSVARTSYTSANEVVAPLEILWGRSLGREVYPPVLANATLYTLTARSVPGREHLDDRRLRLQAFDTITGRERWRREDVHGTDLAYDGGRVFLGGGAGLTAYDAETGRELWSAGRPTNDVTARGLQHPVASDGLVYTVDGGSGLYAHEAATGKPAWTQSLSGLGQTYPALARGRVFTSSGCDAAALDARSGQAVWTYRVGCSTGSEEIARIQDGRLYGDEDGDEHAMFPLDVETGKPSGPRVSGSMLAPGIAVFGRWGIEATSLSTGKRIWSARTPEPYSGFDLRPAGAGATVWMLDRDGWLNGYGLKRGERRERIPLFGENTSMSSVRQVSLAIGEGVLAVPVTGHVVVLRSAIRPAAGETGMRLSLTDIRIGGRTRLDGRVGSGVAPGRMQVESDPYPYGHFGRAGTATVDPDDGTFRLGLGPDRNTRYRVRPEGGSGTTRTVTAYVAPRVSIAARDTGRSFAARIGVRGAKGVGLGGRRIAIYVARAGRRTYERLGAGTLRRTGSARASATASLRRVRFGSKDGVAFCIRGLTAMGRQDRLARRCGAAKVPW